MKVPYEPLPSVAPDVAPGARLSPAAPPEAFGGGPVAGNVYGEAHSLADEAGKLLYQQHKDEQEKMDMAKVNDAIVATSELKNKLLRDPQNGYLFKRGEAAAAAYQPTFDAFKKGAAAINDSLTTPEQKAKYQQHLVQAHVNLDDVMSSHMGTEVQNKVLGSAAAAADSFGNDAIAAATTDPSLTARNIESQRQKLGELADLHGVTDKVARDAFIDASLSKTHFGVLQSLSTAGQDLAASNYFNDHKAEFRGEDLIQAQRIVESGSYRGSAQRKVSEIFTPREEMTKTGDSGNKVSYKVDYVPPSEQETYDAVDKIQDPKLQDMVRERVRQGWEDRKRIARDTYAKDVDDAENMVARGGSVDAVPTPLLDKMKGKELRGLQALAQQINKREPIQTKWDVYSNLKDMAANPSSRNDFLKILPMGYRADLSDTEFKELVNVREGLIKGDANMQKKMDGYRTITGIVDSALDGNGFKKIDKPKERETIEQIMDEEVKYYRTKNNGEDPPNEEVQKMITKLTTEAVVDPSAFFGGKEIGYATTKKYLDTADSGIPADERKKIEDAMKRNGIVPTRRGILEAYAAKRDPANKWLPK